MTIQRVPAARLSRLADYLDEGARVFQGAEPAGSRPTGYHVDHMRDAAHILRLLAEGAVVVEVSR